MIKLRGSKVLVDVVAPSDTSKEGIYLPESAREERYRAEVVALGPGFRQEDGSFVPIDGIKIGDDVCISKYGAMTLVIDGKPYLLYDENDIYGVYGSKED